MGESKNKWTRETCERLRDRSDFDMGSRLEVAHVLESFDGIEETKVSRIAELEAKVTDLEMQLDRSYCQRCGNDMHNGECRLCAATKYVETAERERNVAVLVATDASKHLELVGQVNRAHDYREALRGVNGAESVVALTTERDELRTALESIHKVVGGCVTSPSCDEDTCLAQPVVTEVHGILGTVGIGDCAESFEEPHNGLPDGWIFVVEDPEKKDEFQRWYALHQRSGVKTIELSDKKKVAALAWLAVGRKQS